MGRSNARGRYDIPSQCLAVAVSLTIVSMLVDEGLSSEFDDVAWVLIVAAAVFATVFMVDSVLRIMRAAMSFLRRG